MRLRAILAFAVAIAGLVLAGPTASAAAYPPATCPTLSMSTTTPLVGESIVVTGSNFSPNAAIRIELHTKVYVLANVTSDADGAFRATVKLPAGVTGTHLLVAIGGDIGATGCPTDPLQIVDIQVGAGSSAPPAGGSSSGGGTAFTGLDVLALIVGAAVLLAAGVALNRSGKRRRQLTQTR
jgi:hypothetical protein